MSVNLTYKSEIRIKRLIVSLYEVCLKVLSVAKKLTYSKCPSETQKFWTKIVQNRDKD